MPGGTELIASYYPGGYHPVHIGDVVGGKYKILNKLGFGVFSTVWIVEDLFSGRFSSLKIVKALASTTYRERDVVRHLKRSQGQSNNCPGQEFVMEIIDDFLLQGPNGDHLCIVTELLGPSLQQYETVWEEFFPELDGQLPATHTKRVCAQISQGLAYLHDINIVHGDLHLGNIVVRIPGVEQWTRADLDRYFGQPQKTPIRDAERNIMQPTSSNVPDYLVVKPSPMRILKHCFESIDKFNVKICDFGEAFIWDGSPKHLKSGMPRVLAAPEILFSDPLTPSVDVWALACLMYLLLSDGYLLFPGDVPKRILQMMVRILGKLPDRFWNRWDERTECLDEDLIANPPFLSQVLAVISTSMTQSEGIAFELLVRRMVCYDVAKRATMNEVVQLLPKDWIYPIS